MKIQLFATKAICLQFVLVILWVPFDQLNSHFLHVDDYTVVFAEWSVQIMAQLVQVIPNLVG